MSSNSLLPNKYFDKLAVNRLQAVGGIRSNNIESLTPSYLYSLIFDGTFEPTNNGGILKINNYNNALQFTDRPLRKTSEITEEDFIKLFTETIGVDTFKKDPPNGVLVYNGIQQTFSITYNSQKNEFNLNLISNETLLFDTINNKSMSLFVDDGGSSSSEAVEE